MVREPAPDKQCSEVGVEMFQSVERPPAREVRSRGSSELHVVMYADLCVFALHMSMLAVLLAIAASKAWRHCYATLHSFSPDHCGHRTCVSQGLEGFGFMGLWN